MITVAIQFFINKTHTEFEFLLKKIVKNPRNIHEICGNTNDFVIDG